MSAPPTISFILNVAADLPEPCSIKSKTDGDSIEFNKDSNNNNNKNNINNKLMIIIITMIIVITIKVTIIL